VLRLRQDARREQRLRHVAVVVTILESSHEPLNEPQRARQRLQFRTKDENTE
jgi:hypothetical protein